MISAGDFFRTCRECGLDAGEMLSAFLSHVQDFSVDDLVLILFWFGSYVGIACGLGGFGVEEIF